MLSERIASAVAGAAQGTTFAGRTHVPVGETFSRNPQTGPQLQYDPSNP